MPVKDVPLNFDPALFGLSQKEKIEHKVDGEVCIACGDTRVDEEGMRTLKLKIDQAINESQH